MVKKCDMLLDCDTWQMIAIHGIIVLLLDRRILPVHLAFRLVTANAHVRAIEADLEFIFHQSTRPRPLRITRNQLQLGVPSDWIRIGYCLYHIHIRTQPSDTDTDTDIGGCEKMISVSVKIGYRIWIRY